MLPTRLHATFVPADPPRHGRLLCWSAEPSEEPPAGPDGDHPTVERLEVALPDPSAPGGVAVRTVTAVVVGLRDAVDDLVALPADDRAASPSARAWAVVARGALEVVARGRLRPSITDSGLDSWSLGPLDEVERARRAALAQWLPPAAHCATVGAHRPVRVIDAQDAVAAFATAVADLLPRTAAAPTLSRGTAWAGDAAVDVGPLRSQLAPLEDDTGTVVGLRLEFPDDESDPFRIELQVRSALDASHVATAAELWEGRADGFDERAETDLLLALRRGSRLWSPLRALLDDPRPAGLEVDDAEAMELFGPLAEDLGSAGIEVLVPHELTRTVRATAHVESPPGAADEPPRFDLATVSQLTWRATLDGEPVSDAELSALASSTRPLVRLRGRWVVVDPAVARRLRQRSELGATDTLAAALGAPVEVDGESVRVEVTGSLSVLADRLRAASEPHEAPPPPALRAELRAYQLRGLAWLTEMTDLGLGGVLADDMGLGKTVQVIAVHLARRPTDRRPTLVVCPASLVGNWQREFERFAPSERILRYHGADRSLSDLDTHDVVLTTYGLARRDVDVLARTDWGLVVADEAQQIKNPASATARALRRLGPGARLALTGTPVENRLTELWALLDWTTPGLLGPVESFRRNVAIPIERDRDDEVAGNFARLVAPFLLRRRKEDPTIAPDLPPRTVTDHPVRLTSEQASLYRAVVEDILESIESSEGIARRGLVLKLLTALKQICNHPAHYLGQPGPLAGRSGKLDAFDDLVGSIADAGDATLVFTQYVAMGDLLVHRLGELGLDSDFLHGGTSLPRRAEMVDRFQAGGFPVFVVSLRAGGTGLNLTQATHVIHYDRWWNPAVENQASDRVWRIGQDRPVQIHRLISEGTVEDRIAEVLEHKADLAERIVGGGETWLTELDDVELAALVRLGGGGS